jgi:hypothetical protein
MQWDTEFCVPLFTGSKQLVTITLPPELERTITEQAQRNGTTPELFLLDDLWERFMTEKQPEPPVVEGQTMADFLKDYIGCVDSSETYPEGSRLSEDTGRKFAELMVEKRKAEVFGVCSR